MIADLLESLAKASNDHGDCISDLQIDLANLRISSIDATKKVTYAKFVNCVRNEFPDDLKDPKVADNLVDADVVTIACRLFDKDRAKVVKDILKEVEGEK